MPAQFIGLQCDRISITYTSRQGNIVALQDVSFRIADGEFVCIVGPSGCGKSTLLKVIAGLLQPDAGDVHFAGIDSAGKPENALVFQDHALFPWMNIIDNVAFGLETQGIPKPERYRQASVFLEQLGMLPFAKHYPREMSVGMRQRAAIARAFLRDPYLLLMDEPFSALDAQSKHILQEELLRIWKAHRKMVIYVTHDIDEAVLLADRILVMSGRPGRIKHEFAIQLPRPRNLRDRNHPDLNEIVWKIWESIKPEAQLSLQNPG